MGETLLKKVWDRHTVRTLPTGQTQLFIGLHLIHEVTTPQAFDALRLRGWRVARPDRTFATVDHIVPTRERARPFLDVLAEDMIAALERNCRDFGIRLAGLADDRQGIVHVIGPELGLTQPGMTIACGDSHTSTHGAFGAVAFGIGTSQVRDVLASQCLALEPLKVRRIRVTGQLPRGVYAKDVILTIIQRLGVGGGVGYAYEYAGDTIECMSMDERMTICNMSIEGGARVGYVNPDETTFAYLKGRPFAPAGEAFERARAWWKSIASDADAKYDDEVVIRAEDLTPVVTWGVNPGQSIGIGGRVPSAAAGGEGQAVADALSYMGLQSGKPIAGLRVDVAFLGSCTNSRLSDLREAARIVRGRKVASHVKALVVPGSAVVGQPGRRVCSIPFLRFSCALSALFSEVFLDQRCPSTTYDPELRYHSTATTNHNRTMNTPTSRQAEPSTSNLQPVTALLGLADSAPNNPKSEIRNPQSDRIARLPKETRDMINVMLADGVPHHILIEELAEAGEGLNAQSLADWVQGRYQDYLAHREDVEQAKSQLEFATDLIRELGDGDPTLIYRACNVLVAHQIFKAIREFGDEALREMLQGHPCTYTTLVNSLCNLSNAEVKRNAQKQALAETDQPKT